MPKKKDQAINNDLQNTTQETKDLATRTSLISGVNTGGFSLISGVNTGGVSLYSYIIHGITFKIYCLHFI